MKNGRKTSKKEIENAISEFEHGKLTLKELKAVMGGETPATDRAADEKVIDCATEADLAAITPLFLRKVDVI